MGGKGYKPRKDYAGRTVSGDWEDSDRGSGNKATRRAGGEVEAKSPTYIAHVVNKGKKKVDPKKNPVVGEATEVVSEVAGAVVKQGVKQGGKALLKQQLKRKVVRQGIKVAGKTGGRAAQGGISGAIKGTSSAIQSKKAGKGEKIGKVVGGLAGGIAGGAAGVPLGGVGAVATGVAGGEVGERIGGAIGKKFDKKKPTPAQKSVKTESYASPKTAAEKQKRAKLDALLKRMEDRKIQAKKVNEAKQEAGYISNAAKAEVRNQRRFGKKGSATPQGYFGQKPSEKAQLAVKRGEEHEARRGVKTKGVTEAKVDAGLSPEEKEKVRNKRKFGISHNVAKTAKLRRSLAKMHRGDKKIPGDKSKWMEMESLQLGEEGYDRWRDDRLVKYGIGHDGSDRKGSTSRPTGKQPKGKTVYQKQAEKEHGKGATALDIVKKNIEKEHGKGAIYDGKKK